MGYRALEGEQGMAQKMEGEDMAVQGRAGPGAPSEGGSTHPDTTAAAKCRPGVQVQVQLLVDPFPSLHSSGAGGLVTGFLPNPSLDLNSRQPTLLDSLQRKPGFFKGNQHRMPLLSHLGLQEHFNLFYHPSVLHADTDNVRTQMS